MLFYSIDYKSDVMCVKNIFMILGKLATWQVVITSHFSYSRLSTSQVTSYIIGPNISVLLDTW